MSISRRRFLGWLGAAGAGASMAGPARAAGNAPFAGYPESLGVLFDVTRCIGCRKCEEACNKVNELPAPAKPFGDLSVSAAAAAYHGEGVHGGQPPRECPGREGTALPQDPVQPLPRTRLRLGLLRAGLHQERDRRGHVRRIRLRRVPVLHDRLPLRDPGLRVRQGVRPAHHEVHLLPAPAGEGAAAGVRRGLPHRGPDLRAAPRSAPHRP